MIPAPLRNALIKIAKRVPHRAISYKERGRGWVTVKKRFVEDSSA
ncbi:hypothetical protein [Pyrobaculum arsenaticum]|nr:hypothetical protein [Pyrobaculum arsenaticum]